jgi:hypothetical protein
VGATPDSNWPLEQWKDVNNNNQITFNLSSAQAGTPLTLRIGISLAQFGGRPQITVNSGQTNAWASSLPSPSSQPNSRGITRGTWRGNETIFTYNIPTSALVAGNNTINISVNSGTAGTGFLSPGITYDAIDLVPTASLTNAPLLTRIAISPVNPTLALNSKQAFAASAFDQFNNAMPANVTWSASNGVIDGTGLFTAGGSPGSATIIATSGSVSGQTTVTVANTAPTVASAASASPTTVTGKTTSLSVLAADDGGESNLTYTWTTTGTPPAGVTFSANGTNASKTTTATFTKAGAYAFQATITDSGGLSTTSSVNVVVNQTLTSLAVTPATGPSLGEGATQQFTAAALDQFANAMNSAANWSTTGANTISNSGLFTAGNTAGTYTVTAASGAVSGSATIIVNLFGSSSDIGSVGAAGSSSLSNGIYTLSGSGADIWGAADAFRYTYVPFTGDGQIVARVNSVQNTNAWAKAGVMFRSSLAANSQYAGVFLTPGAGVAYQYRSSAGGSAAQSAVTSGLTTPYWVKLVRSGNAFLAYRSADGTIWTQVGSSVSISMGSTIYVGLAVTAHNNSALCSSTFSNVTLTPYANLALKKTATASSTAPTSSAANAIDGNTTTAWISAAGGTQTLTVDLGTSHTLSELKLTWGTSYAKSFNVQFSSNGSTWTNLYSTTSGTGSALDLQGLTTSARYVRITMTLGISASQFSINELALYGL